MPLADFLNPDELPDADEIDKRVAAGGLIAAGPHYAWLISSEEKDTENNSKHVLGFEILSGQFKGRKIWFDLFHHGADEKKEATARDHMCVIAYHLGLMHKVPGGDGKPRYDWIDRNRTDFADAINTECIIEVHHEPYSKEDKRPMARIKMYGVHAKDSDKFTWDANGCPQVATKSKAKKGGGGAADSGGAAAGAGTPPAGAGGNGPPTASAPPPSKKANFNVKGLI